MTTIRNYTDDFKNDAVKYALEHHNVSIRQTAEYLNVPSNTLYTWLKVYRRKLQNPEANLKTPMTESEKELERLRRENRDLQDAIEILKKAISILNK